MSDGSFRQFEDLGWSLSICEVCVDGTKAVFLVDRTWGVGDDKGVVDLNIVVCEKHSQDDPDGWWTMTNKRPLPMTHRIDDNPYCGRCLLPINQCCCKPRGDK